MTIFSLVGISELVIDGNPVALLGEILSLNDISVMLSHFFGRPRGNGIAHIVLDGVIDLNTAKTTLFIGGVS